MSSFVKASGGMTPNSADPGEEFPFLHTITVVDRVVSVDKPELVQNNIKTETVTLNLDSEWEGLSTYRSWAMATTEASEPSPSRRRASSTSWLRVTLRVMRRFLIRRPCWVS